MRHGFYVYYRIEATNKPAALIAVQQLFSVVLEHESIAGRLLKRADDAETWMEIYEGIRDPARFRARLDGAAISCGMFALAQDARRHVEHFEEVDLAPVHRPD